MQRLFSHSSPHIVAVLVVYSDPTDWRSSVTCRLPAVSRVKLSTAGGGAGCAGSPPVPGQPSTAQLSPGLVTVCTVTVSTRGWVSNYGCPTTIELHNYNLTLLHNQGSLTPARHFSTHGNRISTSLRIILHNRARMLEGNYFAATQWRSLKAGLECLVFTWPGFHRFLTG